jgi:hypothetical protein
MTRAAIAIVVAGIALSVAVGVAGGMTLTSGVMLGAIVGMGALVIAVARKARTGGVGPASCDECGGLISANAPVCKHCGAPTPVLPARKRGNRAPRRKERR